MRPDQLRFSAYEVHVLRSILRDWRESNLIPTTPIPDRDLGTLQDRLDHVDVDLNEVFARSHVHGDSSHQHQRHHHPSVGLGAPGDIHHPLATPAAALRFSVEP